MVFDYVVILRNTSRRSIDVINTLLAFMAIIFLGYKITLFGFFNLYSVYSLVLLVILLLIGYAIAYFRKKKFLRPALVLYLLGWFIILGIKTFPFEILFGIVLVILFYLEEKAKSNLEIGFSPQFIFFDNLLKKKYQWTEFNNIILKDNILTLDFKNNRVYQRETIDEDSDCDEDEFNQFCREQLIRVNGTQK